MLNNPIYRGQVAFNRQKFIKDPVAAEASRQSAAEKSSLREDPLRKLPRADDKSQLYEQRRVADR
jgi:hypothetical protein